MNNTEIKSLETQVSQIEHQMLIEESKDFMDQNWYNSLYERRTQLQNEIKALAVHTRIKPSKKIEDKYQPRKQTEFTKAFSNLKSKVTFQSEEKVQQLLDVYKKAYKLSSDKPLVDGLDDGLDEKQKKLFLEELSDIVNKSTKGLDKDKKLFFEMNKYAVNEVNKRFNEDFPTRQDKREGREFLDVKDNADSFRKYLMTNVKALNELMGIQNKITNKVSNKLYNNIIDWANRLDLAVFEIQWDLKNRGVVVFLVNSKWVDEYDYNSYILTVNNKGINLKLWTEDKQSDLSDINSWEKPEPIKEVKLDKVVEALNTVNSTQIDDLEKVMPKVEKILKRKEPKEVGEKAIKESKKIEAPEVELWDNKTQVKLEKVKDKEKFLSERGYFLKVLNKKEITFQGIEKDKKTPMLATYKIEKGKVVRLFMESVKSVGSKKLEIYKKDNEYFVLGEIAHKVVVDLVKLNKKIVSQLDDEDITKDFNKGKVWMLESDDSYEMFTTKEKALKGLVGFVA